mgnify:CR=1 FL=1|tara:strand:+ start:60 stop:596 length:537 start_codon:yes stop_codon:yes gene_type:complete
MGIILLLLSCVGVVSHDFPLLRINNLTPADVIVIGKPQQKHIWKDAPSVRVCTTTEVPLYRIQQSLHYWENLGYKFDSVYEDPTPNCMHPRAGEIIITLPEPGFSADHMAATRLYTYTRDGDIMKAKIFILPKHARKDRVIEHELGHALGWKHHPQKFHIMHPTWHLGGYESTGLKKR